jgi:Flp pilus assembly protein TadD
MAWIHAVQGRNLDEAIVLARRARDLAPDAAGVLDTLGFVHYRRAEYDKAEPALRRAAELASGNATIHYHLGMTLYRLGRHDDAVSALRRALQLDESLPEAAEIRNVLTSLKR